MAFTDLFFLLYFMPSVILVHLVLPLKYKNYWLFFSSIFFYGWGEPKFVFAMLISIVLNYLFALAIYKTSKYKYKKVYLILAALSNLGLLFVFKYLNFASGVLNYFFSSIAVTNIALPIGISFFTFQALSYVIDVYRGTVRAQKNPFKIGLYIAMFPQLVAGPIVRYSTIEEQIDNRTLSIDKTAAGLSRFIVGLAKKVLLANSFSVVADRAFNNLSDLSFVAAWLGIFAYCLQLYFDFSGYSDMAIGLGKMLGFEFLENFNYPFISKSVSELWRRWNISLGAWFRDYVYFPLGGSRVERKTKLIFNLFVVWLLTGIWHGADWAYIIWGLLFFIVIAIEKLTNFPRNNQNQFVGGAYRAFALFVFMFCFVFFRAANLTDSLIYLKAMFFPNVFHKAGDLFYFYNFRVLFVVGILAATPIFIRLQQRLEESEYRLAYCIVNNVFLLLLFIMSISSLVMNQNNPFIYFNF